MRQCHFCCAFGCFPPEFRENEKKNVERKIVLWHGPRSLVQQSNSFSDAKDGVGDEDKSIKFIRQFSCSLLREDDSESIKLIAIPTAGSSNSGISVSSVSVFIVSERSHTELTHIDADKHLYGSHTHIRTSHT